MNLDRQGKEERKERGKGRFNHQICRYAMFLHFAMRMIFEEQGKLFAIRSCHLASKQIYTQAPAVKQISRVKLPEHGYAVHRLRLKLSPALSRHLSYRSEETRRLITGKFGEDNLKSPIRQAWQRTEYRSR